MYTDDEQRTGVPLKTFIISLILIIIFILLLMWLIPMPKYSNNNGGNNNGDESELNALTNRIFNANLQEMKNAATSYFTTDKLPQRVGDSNKLTLQELLDMKLLLPFTDKNGKSCDTKESYVVLTKKEDYYEMKTNLKCDGQEDYVKTIMGCYSYCTSAICEKNEEKPVKPVNNNPSCALYISSGKTGSNGWYTGEATVKFKSKNANASGATIINYGIGTSSTADFNKKDSYKVTKDGSTTVYGYVKDSNGKTAICSIVVKKDTVEPSCKLAVLSGSKSANGNYVSDVVIGFATKTDATSGISAYGVSNSKTAVYNNTTKYTITTNGTHIIYGYVKDKAGHIAKCDITVKRDKTSSSSTPSCTLKVTSGTTGSTGWYIGNVAIGFATKTSTNGATIKSYGIGTKETYAGNSSYTVSTDGTTTVYGYVKDSNGNTATCSLSVKKDSTKPKCSLKVTSGTYNSNGYYTSNITIGFATKTDAASGISQFGLGTSKTYSGNTTYTITALGVHTIYGYVKDKAGNEGICSIKVEKRSNLEYQYKKDIANQYSNWTNWTTSTYNPSDPPSFGKYTLIEIEDLGKTTEVDYYEERNTEAIYQYKPVKVGTITQRYCKDFNYYRDTVTTVTYAVSTTTGWNYDGMVTLSGAPTDSASVKYEFVGYDWKCTGCERTPRAIWNKYSRVSYTVTTQGDVVDRNNIRVECSGYETKTVEVYDKVKVFVAYMKERVPIYKDVYKYRQRTRTLVKKAYTDYKWSVYNDANLLNAGYTYTGNTRVAG